MQIKKPKPSRRPSNDAIASAALLIVLNPQYAGFLVGRNSIENLTRLLKEQSIVLRKWAEVPVTDEELIEAIINTRVLEITPSGAVKALVEIKLPSEGPPQQAYVSSRHPRSNVEITGDEWWNRD